MKYLTLVFFDLHLDSFFVSFFLFIFAEVTWLASEGWILF